MSDTQLLAQIEDAIGLHAMWKMRLKTAVRTGQCDISAQDAACDRKCQLGQWLYSTALPVRTKTEIPYQVIKRLHLEFHRAAGDVLFDVEAGRKAEAQVRLQGEFTERSEKLVRALGKWKAETRSANMQAA